MALSKTTKDHDEIKQWAESRGAVPGEVEATETSGSAGILRFMFPKAPGNNDGALKEIEWDDFFEKFDASGLELLYQDVTSEGAESNFNKLIYPENESGSAKKSSGKKAAKKSAAKKSSAKTASKSAPATKAAKAASTKSAAAKLGSKAASAKKTGTAASKKTSATKSSAAKKATTTKASTKANSSKTASKKAPATKKSETKGQPKKTAAAKKQAAVAIAKKKGR